MKEISYGTWLSMSTPLTLQVAGKQIKLGRRPAWVWPFLVTGVVMALPISLLAVVYFARQILPALGIKPQEITSFLRAAWVVGGICLLVLWPLVYGLARRFMSRKVLLIDRIGKSVRQLTAAGHNYTRVERIIRTRRTLRVTSNKGSWEEEIQVLALAGTNITANEAEILASTDIQKLRWLAEQLSRMYNVPLEDRITGLTLQPAQLNLPYWKRFERPNIIGQNNSTGRINSTGQIPADPIKQPDKIHCQEEQDQVTFSWGSWWDKRTWQIYVVVSIVLLLMAMFWRLDLLDSDTGPVTFWGLFSALLIGVVLSAAIISVGHRLLVWQLNFTRYRVIEGLYFLKFPLRKTSLPLTRLEEVTVLPIEKTDKHGILELAWDEKLVRIRLIQIGSYNDLVWLATEIDQFIRRIV